MTRPVSALRRMRLRRGAARRPGHLRGRPTVAHAADGTVSGTVTEAGSGAPLGGVLVTAFCWDPDGADVGEVCGETQTVADGSYSLTLAAGTYKVVFDGRPAHSRMCHGGGIELFDEDCRDVMVPAGGGVSGIDAAPGAPPARHGHRDGRRRARR